MEKVLRKEIMDRIGRTYFNSCIVINFEDIGFGKENIYVLTKGGLGTQIRVLNWEDEN